MFISEVSVNSIRAHWSVCHALKYVSIPSHYEIKAYFYFIPIGCQKYYYLFITELRYRH